MTAHRLSSPTRRLRAVLWALPAVALGLTWLSPALAAAATARHQARGSSGDAHRTSAPAALHASPKRLNQQRKARQASQHHPISGPIVAIDTHPSAALLSAGKTLFDESCSSCHGLQAQGGALAPNLRGLGAGVLYLWVSNGWMPLASPTNEPVTKPPLFTTKQTVAIAEYVGSLEPGGNPIWAVNLSHASESDGLDVFSLNCAPCHTITGVGDALSNGQFAPTLHTASATQVAEAVRQGPGNMPPFSSAEISNGQLADLAAYVTRVIRHPDNVGGLGLGGVGPVAEGFIALFVGVGGCIVGALWIGERAEDEEAGGHGGSDPHGGDRPRGPDDLGGGVVHA